MDDLIEKHKERITYSERYSDGRYTYRHVHIPQEIADVMPKNKLMSEDEWRTYGITMSPGWIHYMIYEPNTQVLLFRREKL